MLTEADNDTVTAILAKIHVQRWVERKEFPELVREEIRAELRRRLADQGLELAASPYSDFYSVRLSSQIRQLSGYEWPGNLSWDANCYALLMVLWVRLALPRRFHGSGGGDATEPPTTLFPEPGDHLKEMRARGTITRRQIEEEFGRRLGGKGKLTQYLKQLKQQGFIDYSSQDEITEGPMLELMADAEELTAHIRESVIPSILRGLGGDA